VLTVRALRGLPKINLPTDPVPLLAEALRQIEGDPVGPGDVLVVCHTFISKCLGFVAFPSPQVTPRAKALAKQVQKPPEFVQLVLNQSKSVIRADRVFITENVNGVIGANAGVDRSNAPMGLGGERAYVVPPPNPNQVCFQLYQQLADVLGFQLPVILTDSVGRPFRRGSTGIALGVAGLQPLRSYEGQTDLYGRKLTTTLVAVADQLAGVADQVMGQGDEGTPAVVISGSGAEIVGDTEPQTPVLLRSPDEDVFRERTWSQVVKSRRSYNSSFLRVPVPEEKLEWALEHARWAPSAHNDQPWRFIQVDEPFLRYAMLCSTFSRWIDDMLDEGTLETSEHKIVENFRHFAAAPCLFVVATALSSGNGYGSEDLQKLEDELMAQSTAAAASIFLQGLEAQGLASCWYSAGLFASNEVKEILNLPPGWEPVAIILVGFPAYSTVPPPREDLSGSWFRLDEPFTYSEGKPTSVPEEIQAHVNAFFQEVFDTDDLSQVTLVTEDHLTPGLVKQFLQLDNINYVDFDEF
jgi:coenzyme F420-0:L-glutamate ligase/coenzyme F420-1:gamma-L-glutamate ligase